MKRFITCLATVCFGCLPALCRGQTDKSNEIQAGDDSGAKPVQRFVNGYEPALQFLAEELSQRAQADDLLVVWLFDESASMRDDRHEVAVNVSKLHKAIHDKLRSSDPSNNRAAAIEYCIYSFGSSTHSVLDSPTSDPIAVSKSIGRIPVEKSGEENTIHAVGQVIGTTAKLAKKTGRRLVLILVTDESGDDANEDELLEAAVSRAQHAKSPVYVLGREATFGHPYGRMRWADPEFRLVHYLRIRRGPESAMIESLQWNGLSARNDIQSAGCGPYALVRLAKASGGACLMLPQVAKTMIAGVGQPQKRTLLPVKYRPSYESRLSYLKTVVQSPLRSALQEIIKQFDPSSDGQLSIRENWYPLDKAEFEKEAEKQLSKIQHAHRLLEKSIARLEDVRHLRENEPSPRWQAHYDLISAQLATYRLRLQQTALVLDQHMETNPSVRNEKSNGWNLVRWKKTAIPDESQYARLKELLKLTTTREEYLDQLDTDAAAARQLLEDVIDRHPNTPWASCARWELMHGFGMAFRDMFRPSFDNAKISLPRL